MNITGSSNATLWFGAPPCRRCGGNRRMTDEFHSHWLTLCVHCGEEL